MCPGKYKHTTVKVKNKYFIEIFFRKVKVKVMFTNEEQSS